MSERLALVRGRLRGDPSGDRDPEYPAPCRQEWLQRRGKSESSAEPYAATPGNWTEGEARPSRTSGRRASRRWPD